MTNWVQLCDCPRCDTKMQAGSIISRLRKKKAGYKHYVKCQGCGLKTAAYAEIKTCAYAWNEEAEKWVKKKGLEIKPEGDSIPTTNPLTAFEQWRDGLSTGSAMGIFYALEKKHCPLCPAYVLCKIGTARSCKVMFKEWAEGAPE